MFARMSEVLIERCTQEANCCHFLLQLRLPGSAGYSTEGGEGRGGGARSASGKHRSGTSARAGTAGARGPFARTAGSQQEGILIRGSAEHTPLLSCPRQTQKPNSKKYAGGAILPGALGTLATTAGDPEESLRCGSSRRETRAADTCPGRCGAAAQVTADSPTEPPSTPRPSKRSMGHSAWPTETGHRTPVRRAAR